MQNDPTFEILEKIQAVKSELRLIFELYEDISTHAEIASNAIKLTKIVLQNTDIPTEEQCKYLANAEKNANEKASKKETAIVAISSLVDELTTLFNESS